MTWFTAIGQTITLLAAVFTPALIFTGGLILIDNGTICEQGRHHELLARNGRYARMWALGGYEQAKEQAVSSC